MKRISSHRHEMNIFNSPHRRLRAHLDKLPVGYPRSFTGVEIRILKKLFDRDEALIAIGLDYIFRSPSQIIDELEKNGIVSDAGGLVDILRRMASKGSILYRKTDDAYALVPFIIGMFELQIARMTKSFIKDTRSYAIQSFGLEYLSTSERQTRIIPIRESIDARHHIATYDELDDLIDDAGDRIAVIRCVCRMSSELFGDRCRYTLRKDLCIVFRDFADTVVREGWGRAVTREKAHAIARQNIDEGLVMQSSNEKNPQFLCACCKDCCGILGLVKSVPRPADFVASGYRAVVDSTICIGCGICTKRCHTNALRIRREKAVIDYGKCIGCGVCVPKCPVNAIAMEERPNRSTPSRNTEELFERIRKTRPSFAKKIWIGIRAISGMKNHHGRNCEPEAPKKE